MLPKTPRQFGRLRLDRDSVTPAYIQIADGLRSLIESGELAEGAALPSERELCEHFGVSRMTVRQARDVLEQGDLIRSERGRGTFVQARRIQKSQQEFRSFSEEMTRRGGVVSSRLVEWKVCPPDAKAQEFFGASRSETVYHIERIRLVDNIPMVLEAVQILVSKCPDLARFDLEKDSLYRILEQEYGINLVRSVEEIGAVAAAAKANHRLFDIRAGIDDTHREVRDRRTAWIKSPAADYAKCALAHGKMRQHECSDRRKPQ